ncbi:MAG: hypothetical protein ACI4L7_00275 [Christensenellales bacterium]
MSREDEILKKSLISLAKGGVSKEVVEEYVKVGESDELKLKSRKELKKIQAPDLASIKVLLAMKSNDIYDDMTDEELEEEKQRLITLLSKEKEKK